MKKYAQILASGSYLPPNIVTNNDLVNKLAKDGIETSDQWISERTGIKSRCFASQDQKTSDLAVIAAQRAIDKSNEAADDIDLIIVATTTPDFIFPSTACIVQRKLQLNKIAAFDVQAVCSGFVYALHIANSLIVSGAHKKILVIGAEVFSGILNFKDRVTCILFGDGAGAMILKSSDKPGIIDSEVCSDGNYENILNVPAQVRNGEIIGNPFAQMEGQAVYKMAVNVMSDCATTILKRNSLAISDINWLIPHQANLRIMNSIINKINANNSQLISTVANHANTSAASIPLAFDLAVSEGKIKTGDTTLMLGVGGGFTWGGILAQV